MHRRVGADLDPSGHRSLAALARAARPSVSTPPLGSIAHVGGGVSDAALRIETRPAAATILASGLPALFAFAPACDILHVANMKGRMSDSDVLTEATDLGPFKMHSTLIEQRSVFSGRRSF